MRTLRGQADGLSAAYTAFREACNAMAQEPIRTKRVDDPDPQEPHKYVKTTRGPDGSGWHWTVEGCQICGGSPGLAVHIPPLAGWNA